MIERTVEDTDSTRISIPKPPWEEVDGDTYNANHIIHAFKSGKEEGIASHLKAAKTVARLNLNGCMGIIDKFIEILHDELSVNFKDTRIKINKFDEFEVIIVLEKKDYFSGKLDKIYNRYFEYEAGLDLEYDLSVMFTYENKYTNYNKMSLDGYKFFRKPS